MKALKELIKKTETENLGYMMLRDTAQLRDWGGKMTKLKAINIMENFTPESDGESVAHDLWTVVGIERANAEADKQIKQWVWQLKLALLSNDMSGITKVIKEMQTI